MIASKIEGRAGRGSRRGSTMLEFVIASGILAAVILAIFGLVRRDTDLSRATLGIAVAEIKAREIVDTVREAYGVGGASFLDLLDAQRVLLRLQLEEARMDAVRRVAAARLEALCALDFGTLDRAR